MIAYQKFADYYDVFYEKKDYKGECDFVEKVFKKYSKKQEKTILDLGCGTGTHALMLAKRGYKVTGIDSSLGMIKVAQKKAKEQKTSAVFKKADIRKFELNKKFDAAIAMFFVFSYLPENQDVLSALGSTNRHIKKGGLFVFDCWFGPGVISQLPSESLKIIDVGKERLVKSAVPTVDIMKQTVDITYTIIKTSKNIIEDEFQEVHKVRFFFPQEITAFLKQENFKVLQMCAGQKMEETPSLDNWSVTVVAQKV